MAANQHRPRRDLTVVAINPLPQVDVHAADTVVMTGEQYTVAVQALAVLIENWHATRPTTADDDGEQLAA